MLKKRVERLWIAFAILFLMIIILVLVLIYFDLLLYNIVTGDTGISNISGLLLILSIGGILGFFAVVIAALALE